MAQQATPPSSTEPEIPSFDKITHMNHPELELLAEKFKINKEGLSSDSLKKAIGKYFEEHYSEEYPNKSPGTAVTNPSNEGKDAIQPTKGNSELPTFDDIATWNIGRLRSFANAQNVEIHGTKKTLIANTIKKTLKERHPELYQLDKSADVGSNRAPPERESNEDNASQTDFKGEEVRSKSEEASSEGKEKDPKSEENNPKSEENGTKGEQDGTKEHKRWPNTYEDPTGGGIIEATGNKTHVNVSAESKTSSPKSQETSVEKTSKTKMTQAQEEAWREFEWQKTHNVQKVLGCDIITKSHDHKLENGGYIIEKLPRGGGRVVVVSRSKINPDFFTCEAVRGTIESNKVLQAHDAARKNLNIVSSSHQKLKGTSPSSFLLLFMVEVPMGKIFNTYIYGISFDDSDENKTGATTRTIVRYTESEIIARFDRDVTQDWLHKWCLVTGQKRLNKTRAVHLIPDFDTMTIIYGQNVTDDCKARRGVFMGKKYYLPDEINYESKGEDEDFEESEESEIEESEVIKLTKRQQKAVQAEIAATLGKTQKIQGKPRRARQPDYAI